MNVIYHTIFAMLALTIGYPQGGSLFILFMIPYLIFMVMQRNAVFLPALILHSASETSAATVIAFGFILLSVWRYRELIALKLGLVFWALIGLMPIFLWLVWYMIFQENVYPPIAFVHVGYYLSFFAFLYGVLIEKTFNRQILMVIFITLFIVYLIYSAGAIQFTRIIVGFTFLSAATLPVLLIRDYKKRLISVMVIFGFISFITGIEDSSLTVLLVSAFSLIISTFYFYNINKIIIIITGYLPFILIFLLYNNGISNYQDITPSIMPKEINIFNINEFSNRISYKFYQDRAPFWAGGLNQIKSYNHLFPIPNMPEISATMGSGAKVKISFGSHTTFIELVRKYGIIAGGILSILLIYLVVQSRKVFQIKHIEPLIISLFSMAIATTIVLSLTGQYQIMPGYALLSLGIAGIAYSKFRNSGNR